MGLAHRGQFVSRVSNIILKHHRNTLDDISSRIHATQLRITRVANEQHSSFSSTLFSLLSPKQQPLPHILLIFWPRRVGPTPRHTRLHTQIFVSNRRHQQEKPTRGRWNVHFLHRENSLILVITRLFDQTSQNARISKNQQSGLANDKMCVIATRASAHRASNVAVKTCQHSKVKSRADRLRRSQFGFNCRAIKKWKSEVKREEKPTKKNLSFSFCLPS